MKASAGRWALVLALGLATAGCESVMWYGRTHDRSIDARLIARGGAQRVEVGGASHPAFEAIAMDTLAFDRRGRVAYAALHHGGWSIVVDGRVVTRPRPRVFGVSWGARTDTILAVVGDVRGDGVVSIDVATNVPVETAAGPLFEAVARGSVVSTSLGHVGFVGFRAGAAHAVVDGVLGPAYEGIARLTLAPDGEPSYLGRRAGAGWVVRRGEPDGPHLDVADLAGDDEGRRVVAVVRSRSGWHTDDGDIRSPPYDSIGDLLVTSRVTACRATRGEADWVLVDGRAEGPFLAVRPGSLRVTSVGGASGQRVAFVARDVQGERVVIDGTRHRAWSAVTELAVGEDGTVAYLARDGAATHMVRDGAVGTGFAAARDLRVGSGGRAVFLARVDDRDVIVDEVSTYSLHGVLPGTLRLAPDGRTWGALVSGARGIELVTRGDRRTPLDLEELVGELLRRRDMGAYEQVLGAWADAELARMASRGAPE